MTVMMGWRYFQSMGLSFSVFFRFFRFFSVFPFFLWWLFLCNIIIHPLRLLWFPCMMFCYVLPAVVALIYLPLIFVAVGILRM
jgi:hypothetical protein